MIQYNAEARGPDCKMTGMWLPLTERSDGAYALHSPLRPLLSRLFRTIDTESECPAVCQTSASICKEHKPEGLQQPRLTTALAQQQP